MASQGDGMTMQEFVQKHGLVMSAKRVDHNPYLDYANEAVRSWAASANHWHCTLRLRDQHGQRCKFSTFYTLRGADPPTVVDVLDVLVLERQGGNGVYWFHVGFLGKGFEEMFCCE